MTQTSWSKLMTTLDLTPVVRLLMATSETATAARASKMTRYLALMQKLISQTPNNLLVSTPTNELKPRVLDPILQIGQLCLVKQGVQPFTEQGNTT